MIIIIWLVIYFARYQDEFESLGLPASSGVLLVGPPGTFQPFIRSRENTT